MDKELKRKFNIFQQRQQQKQEVFEDTILMKMAEL